MPNNKQAEKRVRQNEKRKIENKVVRTSMRSAMKKVLGAETKDAAEAAMPAAMKRIDKAAKHHVIHANAAARQKSRLAKAAAKKG
jgi:small subunit ribosomal protein S20